MLRSRRALLLLLCAAQFVDVLDVNAVLVALPSIGRELHLDAGGLQWVVTAYVLVFAGCLLAAGRLADAAGPRAVFAAGIALFTVASAACGVAPSAGVLVAARAAQGLGAALSAPAALAMIVAAFPPGAARERAVAAWTGVAAAGGATGILLGGAITGAVGWRWVFLVNVPVGAAVLAAIPRVLRGVGARRATRLRRVVDALDLPGAVAATVGLGLLVLALAQAERRGIAAPLPMAALASAAAALVAFAVRERRAPRPLVAPALLRVRPLVASLLVAGLLTATTSGGAVLATLRLQDVLGMRPGAASLLLLPLSAAVVAGSVAATRVASGPVAVMAAGVGLVAAGSGVAAVTPSAAGIVAWGLLAGLGLGGASVAGTTLGASAVGEDERGTVAGLLNTAAQVGTAVGVAALVLIAGGTHHGLGFGAAALTAAVGAAAVASLVGRATAHGRQFSQPSRSQQ